MDNAIEKRPTEIIRQLVNREARTMKVRIFVTLKNGVLDPQGKAIHHALESLNFGGVNDVRAGKLIELEVDDNVSDGDLENMCEKLLANTVIENYEITKLPAPVTEEV